MLEVCNFKTIVMAFNVAHRYENSARRVCDIEAMEVCRSLRESATELVSAAGHVPFW